MTIDWSSVIGGALGGLAFALVAGLGSWIWLRATAKIRRKPTFIIRKRPDGGYEIEKTRRGIVRNVKFMTKSDGISTSPGRTPEVLNWFDPVGKGDKAHFPIEADREINEFEISWDEGHRRNGSGEIEGNEALIFTARKPKGYWKFRFK